MSEFGPGTYIIKSKSLGSYVGRDLHEDKSLLPKTVFVLPQGVEAPKWEIIKSGEGTYIFKTLGGHITDIDGRLFAVLLPEPPATRWKIEAQPQHGKHVFTIIEAEGPKGWVSPEAVYEQVLVRHLIVGPSIPPHYPPNELFEITPI